MVLTAQIIKKDGKKKYAVLPYEEFQKIQEALADYEDLSCLREAKAVEKDAPTIDIEELKKRIKKKSTRSTRRVKSND